MALRPLPPLIGASNAASMVPNINAAPRIQQGLSLLQSGQNLQKNQLALDEANRLNAQREKIESIGGVLRSFDAIDDPNELVNAVNAELLKAQGDESYPVPVEDLINLKNTLQTKDMAAAKDVINDGLTELIPVEDWLKQRFGFGTDMAKFSAKTVNFADGSSIQYDTKGGRTVTGPDGVVATDPQEVAEIIKAGAASGIAETKSKSEAGQAGKEIAAIKSEINTNLRTLPIQINRLKSIEGRLGNIPSGSGAAFRNFVGTLIPEARGADIENANALFGDFVLQSLGQIKGPITEKELAFIQTLGPQIRNTEEGNRRIVRRALLAAQKDFELAKAQKRWIDQGNDINDFDTAGFIEQAEQDLNSVFSGQLKTERPEPSGGIPTVTTKAAYDDLPVGASYIGPDGIQAVKGQ